MAEVIMCRFRVAILFAIASALLPLQDSELRVVTSPAKILARVNDFEVTDSATLYWLKKSMPNLNIEETSGNSLLDSVDRSIVKGAVSHLVDRRVVLEYLRTNGLNIGVNEIQLELAVLTAELAKVGRSNSDYLKQQGISQSELEYEIEWSLAWEWYIKKVLTDKFLEQHFNRHRRQFDNSEMRVAHLLLKIDSQQNEEDRLQKANQIFEEINHAIATNVESKTYLQANVIARNKAVVRAWNEAVAKYSVAPSAPDGGEIGWIRINEPMPKAFSTAAFELEPGQISRPIVTSVGVHLIRCLELREGKMGWRDSLTLVKEHAAKTLFERVAIEHRPNVVISIE